VNRMEKCQVPMQAAVNSPLIQIPSPQFSCRQGGRVPLTGASEENPVPKSRNPRPLDRELVYPYALGASPSA
jgi:hypothetical protein